jgi:hypothetical protein
MFSQLGPLFKVHLRRTEANDTRQNIPHEERKSYIDSNKPNHQKKKTKDKWNDDTTVSVIALKSFLINFLKTLPEAQNSGFLKNYEDEATVTPSRPPQRIKPSNTHNAKAVRAYQTMATHSTAKMSNKSTDKVDRENKENVASSTTPSNQIESNELRDLHQLITDLDYLQSKNITELNIMKADSFIEGMKEAVTLAKSKI